MWKVRCTCCGFGDDCETWKVAYALALFHANESDHWGRIVLGRVMDHQGYCLRPWGVERRDGLQKKVA